MILYFAGMNGNIAELYSAVKNGCQHLMLSYYHDKSRVSESQWRRFRNLGLHIMLDSGAFSAWKINAIINIDEYIKYIKIHNIGKYISLDEVGNPEKSYYNLKYIEKHKLYPIPVFHFGSDFKYLDQLVQEKYKLIALGGTVGKKIKERREFFNECFHKYKNTYFHGLGMTDINLLKEFEWASIDSSTWLIGRKHNKLIIESGKRITAPEHMTLEDKSGHNVKFFSNLVKNL